jgi:glycosyltransferase involved in cell wall biosynthesis
MANSSLVSILIPNYNKAPYLRETLDSVLAQTYPHCECIIVDYDSTDNSWEILEEYAQKDSRFKIYRRPDHLPKGGNTARNYALEKSVGNLCLFLDSDDILRQMCLANRIELISKCPQFDFWVFNVEVFDKEIGDLRILWNIDLPESDLVRFIQMDGIWQTSGPIYSSTFVKNLGGFSERIRIWQDYEFHFRSILSSRLYYKKLDNIPDVGVRYSNESLSRRKSTFGRKRNLIRRIEVFSLMLKYYKERKVNAGKDLDFVVFSSSFNLVSQVYVKYGNWNKFYLYWKQYQQEGFFGKIFFYMGLLSCVISKITNRFPVIKRVLNFNNNIFPDFHLIWKSKMCKMIY